MSIHFYTQPKREWDDWGDIEKRAEEQGYKLVFIAGYDMFDKYGREGGPCAVFKDGNLVARFPYWYPRDKWLHELLSKQSDDQSS